MPAEWERHHATWLSWPKNDVTWPGSKLKAVRQIYTRMIAELTRGEKVHLLVPDRASANTVYRSLPRNAHSSRLVCFPVRYVDSWIRDYGPIFVKREADRRGAGGETVCFTKWVFNAWGGKYADLARDNAVVSRIAYFEQFRKWEPGIVLEGGSIDVNGRGTLLTTEQCLLNKNRNPRLTRSQIETYLKKYLGLRRIIWLKEGIEGDDTDGHVDDITRFVNARTILTAVETNPADGNYGYLAENWKILERAVDQDGRKFQVEALPMPGKVGPPRSDTPRHKRLPASYANFYIGNSAVLVPVYSHRNDRKALSVIRRHFPKRRVVGIECSALVYGMGSIHCVTQQQPQ